MPWKLSLRLMMHGLDVDFLSMAILMAASMARAPVQEKWKYLKGLMDGWPENSLRNDWASSEMISQLGILMEAKRLLSVKNSLVWKIRWLYPNGKEAYRPKKSK